MVDLAFLKTPEYKRIMQCEWSYRHSPQMRQHLGVWRWMGIYEHRTRILQLLEDVHYNVVDFGGGLGTIHNQAHCVDLGVHGRGFISELDTIDGMLFTSHTLEHLPYVHMWISYAFDRLQKGCPLVIHVPGLAGAEWWHPSVKDEHLWLFSRDEVEQQDSNLDAIIPLWDVLHRAGFVIESCENTGDSSILAIARR